MYEEFVDMYRTIKFISMHRMQDMDFEFVLKKSLREELSKGEALFLLKKASRVDRFLELFKVASRVRDDEVGDVFKFDGFIGPITPCTTNPPCRYCSRSAKQGTFLDVLSPDEVALGAKLIEETGTKRVELGGGTLWSGADELVLNAVKAVKSSTRLEVWINVGPCLSKQTLEELRDLGVSEVGASLETINEQVFKDVKPGDSLQIRMEFAKTVKSVGLKLMSVMMVGIRSTYEDYVNHIFWLKEIGIDHMPITGFNPLPSTPLEMSQPAWSYEVAKVVAIARLILRKTDISVGGIMNDPQLLPLAVMAGANRVIHLGAHVHRAGTWPRKSMYKCIEVKRLNNLEFVNMLPLTTKIIKELGMRVDVE
jgi:biotin synthase